MRIVLTIGESRPGNHCCMGKLLQTARQLFPVPSGRGRLRRFATWLEDAGIPSRVIDELMGHTGDNATAAPAAV
jgi:integrase